MGREQDEELVPAAFKETVDKLSLKLMTDVIKDAHDDPLIAVGALVMAAGRAAGMSGAHLGTVLNLFASQYLMHRYPEAKTEATEGVVLFPAFKKASA